MGSEMCIRDRAITIHGQADQWRLKGSSAQRNLLDSYAGAKHAELLSDYGLIWDELVRVRERYQSLTVNHDQQQVELRYLKEITTSIENMELSEDEEETIDVTIDRLTNVQELRESVRLALELFDSERTEGLVETIGRTAELLRRATRQDASLAPIEERISQTEVEISSLASDLRDYMETLFDDPEELSRLHDRRASLTDLMRGRAATVKELMEWFDSAQQRITELEDESADPETAAQHLRQAELNLVNKAEQISRSRKVAAKKLEKRVGEELSELGLANAKFSVRIEKQQLSQNGCDGVTMMLQPHPSMPPAPISQGASGGELSRIMLALEVALAENDGGKTFVFDEIDAGIGGTTIGAVASRLLELSQRQQVIVVTHQPQIAVMADANFVVRKHDGVAEVTAVEGKDRTDEIVRMLGGDTEAARKHAIDLEARALAQKNKTA